jgi:hypothetical protein
MLWGAWTKSLQSFPLEFFASWQGWRPHLARFYSMQKLLASMNKNTSQGQILIPFAHSFSLLPDDFAGRIARTLDESGVFFCHHSTMVFMLIYHIWDEQ